ncbi:MAG TPA: hypothetical protein VHF89_06450, partial [Solirubrobacteraceae bacterium]|nr:hypothetical protein [Solirubrobacteraceae bacterium]
GVEPSPAPAPAPAAHASPRAEPRAGEPLAVEPDDETRRRLQAIAAELRAAVPEPGERGRGDVIGDLQRAAERLRAAAEQELERLGEAAPQSGAPPAPSATSPVPSDTSAAQSGAPPAPSAPPPARSGIPPAPSGTPPAEQLTARHVDHGATESAWLRTGVERLAHRDPDTAARLLAALLPAQALVVDDLAYDLTSSAGTLRVVLSDGTAHVAPRPAPGGRHEVDAHIEGPLDALVPLAAGGTGWRLKGATVRGSRRAVRRLLKARRQPVTLSDLGLGRAGSPVHPGLLLAALAAAVDPAWTRGHRFRVVYDIEGDGISTVVAHDGAPLLVHHDDDPDATARVTLSAAAFMPVIAGAAPPPGERAAVTGERGAVDTLHAWFDATRGVAAF